MDTDLNYNFFNTLIFSGIIYGFVFCSLALSNRKYYSEKLVFLILTVLSLTLSYLQYWLIDVDLREKYQIPKVYYIQFELLIIPFYYLFITQYLGNKVDRNKKLILMMPFILGMTYQLVVYAIEVDSVKRLQYNLIVEVLTIAFVLILILLVFKEILIYEKRMSEAELSTNDITVKTK